MCTGLRRGELLGSKWSAIDWKNSYRAVSISPQAIEVLREQKRKTNDQYIFPSPNGGPISPDSVNNMLKRVLERAGMSSSHEIFASDKLLSVRRYVARNVCLSIKHHCPSA